MTLTASSLHRLRRTGLCLLFAVWLSGPAHDAVQARERGPAETAAPAVPAFIVDALVRWIGRNSDYDIADTLTTPPRVVLVEAHTRIAYEGEKVMLGTTSRAVYDLPKRLIHLRLPWSVANVRDVSVLLHELIHDVQYRNRGWSCRQQPEWQAYKLQQRWLEEQGVESGFNWIKIYFLSRCPRDHHP